MGSTIEKRFVSPAEYLDWERQAAEKSEYHNGEVFALAGASFVRNRIVGNVLGELKSFLKGKPCDIFPSDLRLSVPDYNVYAYPDMMIICGEPEFTDGHTDTVTNPAVIFEVLSPSTADYDMGTKFMYYRSIPSLRNYIMIETTSPKAVLYQRNEQNHWELTDLAEADTAVPVPAISCELPFSEIYRGVDFDRQKAKS